MIAPLQKIEFGEDVRDLVSDFDCRESQDRDATPWEAEINEWIKADPSTKDGARYRTRRKECKVWLYLNEDDDLVGYGSLGRSKWPDVGTDPIVPNLVMTPITLIPALGVQTQFQGRPEGVLPAEKYAGQILNHLIYEARWKLTERQPCLALYVHPDNERAIKFYRKMEFRDFPQTWANPDNGAIYRSMVLKLTPHTPAGDRR